MRIGINGFGRIGRLVFRQLFERQDLNQTIEVVQVNDPGGDASNAAYLVNHDSVQGLWPREAIANDDTLRVGDSVVRWSRGTDPGSSGWDETKPDLLIECSGRFKTMDALHAYLKLGIGHVLVSAPVSDPEVPNIVVGVNDDAFDPSRDRCVSGASCTTNCVAPVIKVVHGEFGIVRGSINTIHAVTPSQKVMDGFAKDVRRGRAGFNSMIPTTTGAAKAITRIFPELKGHISGLAVRVPLTCPSITDVTLETRDPTDASKVNAALEAAAAGPLAGVLGFESRPLVSVDYVGDPRSSVVDAPSTMVVDGHHVKILAWYDNEAGYSNRLVDLVERLS
ncbi:MAG: glyceraldehyde 3-phosphate dehydrogenase NAD-binding domain-containing protein [Myxococcota bacterium]